MSQENVKVVREAWEASGRHDNEAIFPLYDAAVEIQGPFGLGDRVFQGLRGVQEFWLTGSSEVEEWIDARDDVIAVIHVWGHGKRSGAPRRWGWRSRRRRRRAHDDPSVDIHDG